MQSNTLPAQDSQAAAGYERCPPDGRAAICTAGRPVTEAPQASLDYQNITVTNAYTRGCVAGGLCGPLASGPPAAPPRPLRVPWGWQGFSWQRMADHAAASVPWRAARAAELLRKADLYRGRRRQRETFLRYWTLVQWGQKCPHARIMDGLRASDKWWKRNNKRLREWRDYDGVWHRERAAALETRIDDKVWNCNGQSVLLLDLATNTERRVEVACGDRTCPACADKRARKGAKKIYDNLRQITAGEARSPDGPRRSLLLTFTVRHCGDAGTDARRLQAAWEGWRASWASYMRRKWQRRHGPRSRHPRPGFGYIRVLEVSSGDKRKGHAHLHVLAWLPKWFPWRDAQRWWRLALRCGDEKLGIIYTPELEASPGNLDIDPCKEKTLAGYVTKVTNYVSKFGVDILNCHTKEGAALADSLYGRRWMTTSVGLLAGELPQEWRVLSLPDPVPRYELWYAFAPRTWGVADRTGPPQRDNGLG